jgi:hypothetical protein
MKNKILILFLLLPALLWAQNQGNEGVELPEFVITGSQQVNIPVMKKKRPKLIPVLDQEFFLPAYAPDNLTLRKFNYSLNQFEPKVKKEEYFGGVLQVSGGLHTLPDGIFTIDKNVKHFLIHGKLWGFNINDYVKYSNYNESGGQAGLTLYLSKKSPFMPGMKIASFVGGTRNSFYLFGSNNPSFLRKSDNVLAKVNLQYSIKKYFNYNLNFFTKLFELKEIGMKDYNYCSDGFLQYKFSTAGLRFDYKYLRDEFKSAKQNTRQSDFMYGKVSVLLSPFNSFNAKFGISYAKLDTNIQIVPSASFQLKLDKGIYMFGEYTPYAAYKTFADFFNENRYVNHLDLHGKFLDYYSVIKFAFKFEYEKMLEISAGLEMRSARNLPYFEDSDANGKFRINITPQADFKGAFLETIFRSERFGNFFLKAKVNDVRNSAGNLIPYYPLIKVESVYSYYFPFKLSASVGLNYFSDYYTNIKNTKKIKNYLNLSLDLNYKLLKSLELVAKAENILNRKNYFYDGYLTKTLDMIVGLRYRF